VRVHVSIVLCLLALPLAGCSRQQPKFENRESLSELIPEVQQHIRWVLEGTDDPDFQSGDPDFPGYFGTPTDMVAWERLPIQYHAATGTLSNVDGAVAEGTQDATLGVDLTTQNMPIEPGASATFLSGAYAGASVTVEAFNPQNGLLTLQEQGFESAPAVGDRIVIGAGEVLKEGRMLYAEHCQHCHGVSGDGNGPTAPYLNPPPRDYRLGLFKFTSTQASEKAQRADLAQTILEGIPGTYMPSFKLLSERETQAIVEYVLWLAMRGEIENGQIQALRLDYSKQTVEETIDSAVEASQNSGTPLTRADARAQVIEELTAYLTEDWPDEFDEESKFLAERWANAELETAVVFPSTPRVPDTPESRAEGRRLYYDAKTKCDTCHGPQGLGDGGQTVSVQKDPATNQDYPLPGLYDNWGNPLQPRNLTTGIYRGGRRPIDLYRRMYAGIKGTPMPPFGTVLTDDEIWHLVNYVLSIPFEARERRPGDGAAQTPPPAEVATTGTPADASN
jgi:mono/diheme cytochrome c family protein